MKINHLAILGTAALVMLTAGCGTTSDYVDANDTTAAVKNKNSMSSSDWIVATEKLGNQLLSSPEFAAFLRDYAEDAAENLKRSRPAAKKYPPVKDAPPCARC